MKLKNADIAVDTALGGTGNGEPACRAGRDFKQYIMKNKTKYTWQLEY